MNNPASGAAGFSQGWLATGSSFDEIRGVARVPLRLLWAIPRGEIELGLSGMAYVDGRGTRHLAPLSDDFGGLHLPLGTTVDHLTAPEPLLSPYSPRARHLTLDMILSIVQSPGFQGHLSDRRHPERILLDAEESGTAAGDLYRHRCFVALGKDRLAFFDESQSGWAAAFGQEVPMLAFRDGRLDLLAAAMEWLDDEGFFAAVDRLARYHGALSGYDKDKVPYTRGDVKKATRTARGIAFGNDDALREIPLTADNDERLNRWLRG